MRTSLDRQMTRMAIARPMPGYPRLGNLGIQVVLMVVVVCLFIGSVSAESESLSTLLTEPKLKISGFANGAFLYTDTDCTPIAEPSKTIEHIVRAPTKIEDVRGYQEAFQKVVGTLSLPETMSKRDRDFFLGRVKNSGDTGGEMANVAGAMVVNGQLVFWRLFSDQSLLICTAKGELGEMVLLTK